MKFFSVPYVLNLLSLQLLEGFICVERYESGVVQAGGQGMQLPTES